MKISIYKREPIFSNIVKRRKLQCLTIDYKMKSVNFNRGQFRPSLTEVDLDRAFNFDPVQLRSRSTKNNFDQDRFRPSPTEVDFDRGQVETRSRSPEVKVDWGQQRLNQGQDIIIFECEVYIRVSLYIWTFGWWGRTQQNLRSATLHVRA